MQLDLYDRVVAEALFHFLDRIDAEARTSKHKMIYASECGRLMALRLGISTWKGKRIAKAWSQPGGRRWKKSGTGRGRSASPV